MTSVLGQACRFSKNNRKNWNNYRDINSASVNDYVFKKSKFELTEETVCNFDALSLKLDEHNAHILNLINSDINDSPVLLSLLQRTVIANSVVESESEQVLWGLLLRKLFFSNTFENVIFLTMTLCSDYITNSGIRTEMLLFQAFVDRFCKEDEQVNLAIPESVDLVNLIRICIDLAINKSSNLDVMFKAIYLHALLCLLRIYAYNQIPDHIVSFLRSIFINNNFKAIIFLAKRYIKKEIPDITLSQNMENTLNIIIKETM